MSNKQTILIATTNKDKIIEFKEILKDYNVLSLLDINFKEDIVENGNTYLENSLIKLHKLKEIHKDTIIIADDSGLEIEALPDMMGVQSHRFLGEDIDINIKIDTILKMMENESNRNAKHKVCLSIYIPNINVIYVIDETVIGKISNRAKGENSFAYDKIFIDLETNKTYGELSFAEKNMVSARGLACNKVKEILKISKEM